jgi:hypothetical protein
LCVEALEQTGVEFIGTLKMAQMCAAPPADGRSARYGYARDPAEANAWPVLNNSKLRLPAFGLSGIRGSILIEELVLDLFVNAQEPLLGTESTILIVT